MTAAHPVVGAFLVAHGLVHGIHAGQARRLFEVAPGVTWPDGSSAPVAAAAAIVSAGVLLLACDGRPRDLALQGAYALAIDAAIVVLALLLHWPPVDG